MKYSLRNTAITAFVLGFISCNLFAQDKIITWATNPQYPPYDWAISDTEYAGACIDLLALVIPKDYALRPVMVPWARAQEMAKRGEIDLLVNIRITPERETWLKFSSYPTFINPISVFMRKEKVIPFKSWNELKKLHGGATLGDTFGNGFDEYIKENLTIDFIPNMSGNFQKLNSGRIDYFVTGRYMGLAWLSKSNIQNRIAVLNPPISENSIHLGFSKLSPHLDVLPEINKNLAKYGADGTLNRLLDVHLIKFKEVAKPEFYE